jgi:D-hydroxyproline dehydrogenase subunit beta
METRNAIDTDVCVVGAGIVGLAHALEARRRGLEVVVLERGERAVGASVRNFGHGFVSAMADGPALGCALEARERWIELGRRAGFEVLESGSLIVARHQDELEVMAQASADPRRAARLVDPDEVARLAPIPTDGVLGAFHARGDIRVDPRAAVARIAAWLEDDPGARVMWGAAAHVHAVAPGEVQADGVLVRAPLTVICPGPDYRSLPAELRPTRSGLTLCRLQMLRVQAPLSRRYLPALLTGLSLLRYPAFTTQPGFKRVRDRIEAERPDLVAAGIHLIVAQLPGGDLILGDTHDYGDTVAPFGCERLDRLVLAEAERLLGADRLEVRERWQGVYPSAPGEHDPFLITDPFPGVRVVEVVAGIGMTTALGLAPRVFDEMLAGPSSDGRLAAPAVAFGAGQPLSGEARADCEL